MEPPFRAGDAVQTPLGKGVVREVRGGSRLAIEIKGRVVLLDQEAVATLDGGKRKRQGPDTPGPEPPPNEPARSGPVEVDLHGLTVEEALARGEQAVNDALLDDRSELRLIHGKSGGRIRAALHRRLRDIPAVRGFRLDPRNAGVTIVSL